MTVATQKLNSASTRFQLVRLQLSRNITPGLVYQNVGSVYQYSFGTKINFASLVHNGATDFTQVALGTTLATGQFTVDESTGTITLSGTYSDSFIVTHYVFLTEKENRTATQDPDDSTTTLRSWEPRLTDAVRVKSTFKNLRSGLFTYENTSVAITSPDGYLQRLLGPYDSVYNREVAVWQCFDSVGNRQKVFTGKVASFIASPRDVTLSVLDGLFTLSKTADLGAPYGASSFFWQSTVVFGAQVLNPAHTNRLRPLHLAASSPYTTNTAYSGASQPQYLLTSGTLAANTSWNQNALASNNRGWGLGWIYGTLPTQSFGTIQAAVTRTTAGNGVNHVRLASYSNIGVGDTVSWTISGTTYYGVAVYAGGYTYGGATYNLMVASPYDLTTVATLNSLSSVSLWITGYQTQPMALLQGLDYTLTASGYTNGMTELDIMLVNNFEGNTAYHGTIAALDPSKNDIFYRASSGGDLRHGSVMKWLVESSGLTSDGGASFTSANSSATDKVNFSIPNIDENTLQPYSKYVTDVCQSMLAYVNVNAALQVEYHLLARPNSTDVRNDDLILLQSDSLAVQYQDVYGTVVWSNPHLPGGSSNLQTPSTANVTASYLHGVNNTLNFRHCIDLAAGATPSRASQISALYGSRRATYFWQTATQDIDKSLGDDVNLTSRLVLGGGAAQAVKLTTIEKASDTVTVEAEDLLGL